jgi:hypothetical protein
MSDEANPQQTVGAALVFAGRHRRLRTRTTPYEETRQKEFRENRNRILMLRKRSGDAKLT